MKRLPGKTIISVIFIFILWSWISPVSASLTLNINAAAEKINFNDEVEVDVDLRGAADDTIYYLRIAFTHPDRPAYFGYTQNNNGSFVKYADTYNNFFQLTTNQEGSWSGKLRGKVDCEDNDFKGNGNYILKVGRFTASGKSHDWSDNNLTLEIQGASSTPTATPSVPKPSSTPKPPTSTPKPASTPKATITPRPVISMVTPTPIPQKSAIINIQTKTAPAPSQSEDVLGVSSLLLVESSKATESVEKAKDLLPSAKVNYPILASLIFGGLIFCLAAFITGILKTKNRKKIL